MNKRTETLNTLLICALLAGGTILAFWPVSHAGFVNLDDPTYIADNLRVQRGLSAENVKWAFTTFYFSNWHPLTWLSYMLDCELFGANPTAMHLVNLGFHVANALLLFLLLRRMTGALWASGVVAALFAVHPLHVESVAWIAERKDVLSTFFWILTMWAYVEYVRRVGSPRRWRPFSFRVDGPTAAPVIDGATTLPVAGWYAATLVFFSLGLMSKAMLVTLPFVLLLLDFWPLQRIRISVPQWFADIRRLVFEKLPFFALAATSSYLTFLAQNEGESVVSFVRLPFAERAENAIVSYARYLWKTVWPTDLAVFYPHPVEWSGAQLIGAILLLVALSAVTVFTLRRWPYLFVGWCWFVGTLIPVIGLVQVGGQSIADRYTYVPLIGLFIAVVWGIREFVLAKRFPLLTAFGFSTAMVIACAMMTYRQSGYWKDSLSLFTHAAKITPPNIVVLNNLGDALLDDGRTEDAAEKFKAALELDPEDAWAWGNVGNIFFREGKLDQAMEHYRSGLHYKQNNPELHYNLGLAMAAKGDFQHAIQCHRRALALKPMYLNAQLNLGNAYMGLGNPDAAATNYLAVLVLKPDHAPAHYNLGMARLARKRLAEAILHFSQAVRFDEQFADAHRQLGMLLQHFAKLVEACKHFERAANLKPNDPGIRAQLAALLATMGQTEQAITQYREALMLSPDMTSMLNNLAWMLATDPDPKFRDGVEAVRLAERAVELTERKEVFFLGTLAAAYAEAGRFDDATKTAEEAIKLAEQNGQKELVSKNRQLLAAYREKRPWREPLPGR